MLVLLYVCSICACLVLSVSSSSSRLGWAAACVCGTPGLFSHFFFLFNSTFRYTDGLLNSNNIYFDQMVDRIYPIKLQLNKGNSSDIEAPFFEFESMYILWYCFHQNL